MVFLDICRLLVTLNTNRCRVQNEWEKKSEGISRSCILTDPRICTNTTQRDFRQPKTPPFMKCTLYIGLTAPKTRAYGSGELFGICQNPGSAAPYARACGSKIAERPGFWQGRVYGATRYTIWLSVKIYLHDKILEIARGQRSLA